MALLAVLAGSLFGVGAPGAQASVPCPAALSTLSGANQPGCWRPFTATSPVNTALPANPRLAPNNSAVLQHMSSYGWTFEGGASGFQLDGGGSRPIYFASPSDPVKTVHCTAAYGPTSCQGANGITVNGAQIHVPAGALPASNSDAHMSVIQTDTGQEFDFYHTSISGTTITTATGSTENVNTTDGTKASGDAANLALTAGLLRPSELASGQINHALVIDIPCTNATSHTTGYTWPATGGWGQYCGQFWNESAIGAPNLGQLFRLNMTDAQIATSGAPTWEQTIMTALAHYGAYAEDTNGSYHSETIAIFSQDPTSWTSLGQTNQWANTIAALGGHNGILTSAIPIPTSQLQVVDPCVPEGTCPASPTTNPAIPPIASTSTVTRRHAGHRPPHHRSAHHRPRSHRHHRLRRHGHHRLHLHHHHHRLHLHHRHHRHHRLRHHHRPH